MSLTRSQRSVLALTALTAAVGIATNVATGQLPNWLTPYLWLSWPVLLGLIVLLLMASAHQGRNDSPGQGRPQRGRSGQTARVAREDFPETPGSFCVRLVALLWPWLAVRFVRWGLVQPPPEFWLVHNYLEAFCREMTSRNTRLDHAAPPLTYVAARGIEPPGTPNAATEYATRTTRPQVLRTIRRTVHLLSGLASGGDQATAQLAGLNRTSRMVRDVARQLSRSRAPLVLLGDPGSGKSLTLRAVGLQMAAAGLHHLHPRVVLYVPLGKYRSVQGQAPGDLWELICDSIPSAYAPLRDWLPTLRQQRRLVILFDGMDEMERSLYNQRVQRLSEFASHHSGVIKTLFACRINDFSPEFTHQQLVLLEFDRRQLHTYLRTNLDPWPLQVNGQDLTARQLERQLWQDHDLRETARNPLTLYLLCHFLREKHAWPRTRHELFHTYLERLYKRYGQWAEADHSPVASWETVRAAWARLAFQITNRHAGTSLDQRELEAGWESGGATVAITSGLACGLLVRDEVDEQALRFVHHRLQEYLTACYLDRYGEAHPDLDWASLIDTPRWQETLLHLVSIQQQRCAVLPVIHNSLQANGQRLAIPTPSVAGAPSRWLLPDNEERQLADRIVLASQIIHELGDAPDRVPSEFGELFRQSLARFAQAGRPTTQVKLLWAWNNTAHNCPLSALDPVLYSELAWVREQALQVVSRRTRTHVDADLHRELTLDFITGQLLARVPAYVRALASAGDYPLYVTLGWAVFCQILVLTGRLGLLFGTCLLGLAFLPVHTPLTRLMPHMPQAWPTLGMLLTLAGATVCWRTWPTKGCLWQWTMYVNVSLIPGLYFVRGALTWGYKPKPSKFS